MDKILSVVIPVYKVEKYIDKCIGSLIVPDKKQLELLDVVVINDGTPDKSADMARLWEKKYPGIIRVIDQENRGHGGAWNHGTELAVGKYLFYLDSDDWFETSEFSKLIDFLGTCDTDMVFLDNKIYYEESKTYKDTNRHIEIEPERIYETDQFDWLGTGHGYNMTYAHDTVYRTSMMQKYMPLFCEMVMYDDVSLHAIPIAVAKDFVYVKLDIYRYYIGRPGQSFDSKVRAQRAANDVGKVLLFVLDWIRRNRNAVPKGGTREAYIEESFQSLATWHYRELVEFSYAIAAPRLKEWDDLVKTNFPEIKPNSTVRWYRCLPTWLFVLGMKVQMFVLKGMKFIKRKLKK